jgi:hypothetical protein
MHCFIKTASKTAETNTSDPNIDGCGCARYLSF